MNLINFIFQKFKSLNNFSKWNLLIGGTMVLTVFILYLKYKSFENEFHLSMVPDGLNISKILYVNEENFGLGPGGNETGLIAYELPNEVAAEIKKTGIAYFANMPRNQGENREWRGHYENWNRTPVFEDEKSEEIKNQPSHSSVMKISTMKISNYLDKYGFGIAIEPLIEKQVDAALAKPVSYIGFGRVGILIVAPEIKRVFFAYAG